MQIQLVDPRLTAACFKPQTEYSAGIDMYACLDNVVQLLPQTQYVIPLGIRAAIPEGWVGFLVPRSSLGKQGLILSNSVGVIDSDYRGNICALAWNRNHNKIIEISPLDRIAQMVIIPHFPHHDIRINTNELPGTARGMNGFGSTGINEGMNSFMVGEKREVDPSSH